MSDTYKLLPLDAWHRSRGARMVPFAGYAMPIQYEGIITEHLWTRENAGLFDVSHMGQLVVSGEGAEAGLEKLLPADLSLLALGGMRYSLLLAEDGGILDDLIIARWPLGFAIIVNGAVKHDDIAFLSANLPAAVTIEHRAEHALLALQGPKAAEVLGRLGIIPAMPQIVPVTALSFMQMGPYMWGEVPLGISRSGYTGEDGFEISVRAADVEALAEAIVADSLVKPIGLGARDSLRLEAGLPLYGHDMDRSADPVEAGASFAISKRRRAEGGFNGAERILKALADGPARKLVGFTVEGKMPVREGALIFAGGTQVGPASGGTQVGIVTSGGFSPSLGTPIAMGTVATAHLSSPLEAEVRGKRIMLSVQPMPFVPHHYVRKGASQ